MGWFPDVLEQRLALPACTPAVPEALATRTIPRDPAEQGGEGRVPDVDQACERGGEPVLAYAAAPTHCPGSIRR